MLVLFETPAGFALFKVTNLKKLKAVEGDLHSFFSDPEQANGQVKLEGFAKFKDTTEALAAATAAVEGKLSKGLKKFLKSNVVEKGIKEELAVSDAKIGKAITEKLGVKCQSDSLVAELMRGIRSQIEHLIPGLRTEDMTAMALGLSHSLSRYKLKFSPDKVDTMIVQAISLLDDLDKELNTYCMRVREWFGWHFPELGKLVPDNIAYARIVKTMGFRTNCKSTDLSDILPEEVEQEVKDAAEISMGTEISEHDLENICYLCDQVIDISEYRTELFDYLRNRMNAIAPNLTVMVGELVGARLIAHAGSLLNLAKHPASTVQILGAEKALFRALKTKHDTPKYGLLYHASVVGQSAVKNKGKMSRVLAAKTSLVARVDALADEPNLEIGLEYRAKVDARLRQLEGDQSHRAVSAKAASGPSAHTPAKTVQYNDGADAVGVDGDVEMADASGDKKKKKKKEKKEKKEKKKRKASEVDDDDTGDAESTQALDKKKKKKKKKSKGDDSDA